MQERERGKKKTSSHCMPSLEIFLFLILENSVENHLLYKFLKGFVVEQWHAIYA